MKFKDISKNKFKAILGKRSVKELITLFGYDLTINNMELVDYLEECQNIEDEVDGLVDVSSVVKVKINTKKKKGYVVFRRKNLNSKKDFIIQFKNLDDCIICAKNLDFTLENKLLRYKGEYYLYVKSKLKTRDEYVALEYFGKIIKDKLRITFLLENGEIVFSQAIEKLKTI